LLIHLGFSTGQAKAYGVMSYTMNCPMFRITGTSDKPLQNPSTHVYYVMAYFTNRTTGLKIDFSPLVVRTERIVTSIGSSYILYHFDQSYNFTGYLRPGDEFSIFLRDSNMAMGGFGGICGTSTGTTLPSGYRLMTVACPANILSSPGGPVLPTHPSLPEVGKQRYVLLVGAPGPDGQLYDKIHAHDVTMGFFPRRCLAP
jgi:hypothetical protein